MGLGGCRRERDRGGIDALARWVESLPERRRNVGTLLLVLQGLLGTADTGRYAVSAPDGFLMIPFTQVVSEHRRDPGLTDPPRIRGATDEYRVSDDTLASFVRESCLLGGTPQRWAPTRCPPRPSLRLIAEYGVEQGRLSHPSPRREPTRATDPAPRSHRPSRALRPRGRS